jgi:ABC-2 type transport system ATP-binding protein
MIAVRTRELTKDYQVGFWRRRPYRALDRLSIEVEAGEIYGFLGPNGAGKTTTLKLLAELIYPTSGQIEILGLPPGDLSVKRRIGYLPENPYFYDHLTAEELLHYFGNLFGFGAAERRQRVSALLDEVGIGAERKFELRRFSKGMIQRVGLAQALLNDPDLVLLDEPMSGLDPLGRRDVRELILRLRARGCTVFFSSHILSDAETLCSRVGIVAAGRLVADGPLKEILALEAKGWEIVMDGLTPAVVERLASRASRVTKLSEERYAIDLPRQAAPETLIRELTTAGGRLVSVNPIRETLEDVFVRKVSGQSRTPEIGERIA